MAIAAPPASGAATGVADVFHGVIHATATLVAQCSTLLMVAEQ
jgi:hypothetical protein